MKNSILTLLCLIPLGFGTSALAQGPGSAGVLFLLIQPTPRANGMANASVASTESEALGIVFNPAHLGRIAVERHLMLELYPSKTNWLPQLAPDLGYDAKTILVGYNFKPLNKRIPVSFGVAYSRIFIDLGEQIFTGELDPTPLGVFHSTERANVWSIGVGFDYLVKASPGFAPFWERHWVTRRAISATRSPTSMRRKPIRFLAPRESARASKPGFRLSQTSKPGVWLLLKIYTKPNNCWCESGRAG